MWLFLAIGIGAGILSGLFGIGGGVVIVPALVFFAGMQATVATGTSLGALLLPVGALGVYEYWRRGNIQLNASLWIALGLFFGAWLGAMAAQRIPSAHLQRGFAVFLVAVAVRMWIKAA